MFSRLVQGDYEIFTIKPDGTGVKRLTRTPGNDAHMGWSSDGEHIVFTSARMGFKDEVIYTNAPQPYGELFVMRYDGSEVQQLTDYFLVGAQWSAMLRQPTTTMSGRSPTFFVPFVSSTLTYPEIATWCPTALSNSPSSLPPRR